MKYYAQTHISSLGLIALFLNYNSFVLVFKSVK